MRAAIRTPLLGEPACGAGPRHLVGRDRAAIRGCHRPPWSGRVAARRVSGRPRRSAGVRRELVRSRCLRQVGAQGPPTAYDWMRAAATHWAADTLPLANGHRRATPEGPGRRRQVPEPVRVGRLRHGGQCQGVDGHISTGGRRIALGGAWDEPDYMFYSRDERDPFDRSTNIGFRCARYQDGPPLQAMAWTPGRQRVYQASDVVSDATFASHRELYAYDRTPLQSRLESVEPHDDQGWRREMVSYTAPGSLERLPAFVFVRRAPSRGSRRSCSFPEPPPSTRG